MSVLRDGTLLSLLALEGSSEVDLPSELSIPKSSGESFPNGLEGYQAGDLESGSKECPYGRDGEDSEPLM